MKRLKDMTVEELANLTSEQKEDLIDLECANRGVPLLPGEPEKPEKTVEPDVTIYKVGDFKFKEQEDAIRVMNLINNSSLVTRNWDMTYDIRILEEPSKYDEASIESMKVYSKEQAEEFKSECGDYNKKKEEYDRQKEEHDSVKEERDEVRSDVYDAVRDALKKVRTKDKLKHDFKRYVELAEGDKDMAMKFLEDAHGHLVEKLDLRDELLNMEVNTNE